MLNLTSIRSGGEEKLANYSMRIDFDKSLVFTDRMVNDCVIMGVILEYAYSHDCTFIPLGDGDSFWESDTDWKYIAYKFKTDLSTFEDLAEHIRYLVLNVDMITIHPIYEN